MTLHKFRTPYLHNAKHNLINDIIRLNKIAVEMFDIKLLTKEELYDIKINDLKNIEAELRIQTGFKHRMNFYRGI